MKIPGMFFLTVILAGCASVKPWLWSEPPKVLSLKTEIVVKIDAFGLGHVIIPPGHYAYWNRTEEGLIYVAPGVKLIATDAGKRSEFEGGIMLLSRLDSVNPVRIYHGDATFAGAGELPRYFIDKSMKEHGFAAIFAGRALSSKDRVVIGLPAEGQQNGK